MQQEKQTIEWKESWRDEYLAWICGYANAKGGVLFIGKNDRGEVVGIEKSKKLLEDLPNKVRDVLGIIVDIELFTENNLDYLEIKVEPYPSPINFKGEYHYRTGSTKQVLKGLALNKFLMEKAGIKWDAMPIQNLSADELDIVAIAYFKKRALAANHISESDMDLDTSQILNFLHLYDDANLKRAAALLFHPVPEKYVTGSIIKIGYFRTDTDLVFQDEVRGPLIMQVEKTVDLLNTKYTEAIIKYEGIHRIETVAYPEKALREAVLNAIIHKDYSSGVAIQIRVYADKLTIYNEGKLPVELTPEKFMGSHRSIPANPDIANAFFRAGFIEAWGRGIQLIVSASVEHGLPKPTFDFDFEGLRVEFSQNIAPLNTSNPTFDNLTPDRAINQNDLLPHEVEKIHDIISKLEPKSLKIIKFLEENVHLKRKEIMQHIDLVNNSTNVGRYLEPLLSANIVDLTIKDKPNSTYQEYVLTIFGKKVVFVLKELLKKTNENLIN